MVQCDFCGADAGHERCGVLKLEAMGEVMSQLSACEECGALILAGLQEPEGREAGIDALRAWCLLLGERHTLRARVDITEPE